MHLRMMNLIAPRPLVALLLTVCATTACAQIVLDADFDHGSLDLANSSASGSFVQLAGRDNFNPGSWKWLYFSADNVAGVTPTFQIDDDFATGGSNLNNHEMVYSYDQEEWFFFDNNARSSGAGTFTFSNNAPFAEDKVYVAYGLPYSYGRSVAHTASLTTNPWVASTASGDANLVIAQSPGGVDDLGRVIAPQDLFGYKITDPGSTSPKAKIVLMGGVHANETLGNLTLEAMVDYLVGDSLDAALLRRRAEFYVYPMVNPDGRLAGYNRSTVEFPSFDPNRHWDPPNYDGQSDIRAVAEAVLADTGGAAGMFIDLHSTVDAGSAHFSYTDFDQNMQLNPVWQRFLELEPTHQTFDAGLTDDTSIKFANEHLNASFVMTLETRFIAGQNEDRFVTLGENLGQAFADVFATNFGDLNFDGLFDASDYAILVEHAETETSGLSVIDQYARGDLNGDGWNDAIDFGLFKAAYLDAFGAPAFARLVAGVPEPSAAIVSATCLAAVAIRVRSPRPTRTLPPQT